MGKKARNSGQVLKVKMHSVRRNAGCGQERLRAAACLSGRKRGLS